MKKVSNSTKWHEGQTLVLAWITPGREAQYWGYPDYQSHERMPEWDHRIGPFANTYDAEWSHTFTITPPSGEEWDVKFDFQTNVKMPAGTGGFCLYFASLRYYRTTSNYAATPMYYRHSQYTRYATPRMSMVKTISSAFNVGVWETSHAWNDNAGYIFNESMGFDNAPTTWLKITLLARRTIG